MMLEICTHCDNILRIHLDYQDKVDSSPIEPRNKPVFIEVCQEVTGKYDIEYFRVLHQKMKLRGVIQIGVKLEGTTGLDALFWRNLITQEGFLFYRTTSFVEEYNELKKREKQQEESHQAIVDSTKAAETSAKAAKYSFIVSTIAVVLSVASTFLCVFQYLDLKAKDREVFELKSKNKPKQKLKSVQKQVISPPMPSSLAQGNKP